MNDFKGIIEDCNKSDIVSKKVIEKVIKIIGQKRWNRIHNEESDICTTTGELIITLKSIPDLEEENEELKKESDFYHREKGEYKSAFIQEVRKTIKLNKQLTKAKELLREIIDTPVFNQMGRDLYENEGYTELVEEAEQFLKQG